MNTSDTAKEAANPETPSKRLAELSSSRDDAIRKALVANPALPQSIFNNLAVEYPCKCLENISFVKCILGEESPYKFDELPTEVIRAIIQTKEAPEALIELGWKQRKKELTDLGGCILANPACSRRIAESIGRLKDSEYKAAAALHVSSCPFQPEDCKPVDEHSISEYISDRNLYAVEITSPDCLALAIHVFRDGDEATVSSLEAHLSFNPPIPPEPSATARSIDKFYADYEYIYDAASRGNTPNQILEILSRSPDSRLRLCIARNPSCAASILDILAADKDPWIREAVAANNNCLTEALAALSADEVDYVRAKVATNQNADPVILKRLAADKSDKVALSVAANPKTEIQVLREFISHKSLRVRVAICGNTSLGDDLRFEVASELISLNKPDVTKSLAAIPSAPLEALRVIAEDKNGDVKIAVASNPSTPAQILAKLANSKNNAIREAAIRNQSMPIQLLGDLAKSPNDETRRFVAQSQKVDDAIARVLLERKDSFVISALCLNHGLSEEILEQLVHYSEHYGYEEVLSRNKGLHQKALLSLAGHANPRVRENVASHSFAPREALEQLAEDREESVRAALAGNTLTPREILGRLSTDSSDMVSRRATLNERLDFADYISIIGNWQRKSAAKTFALSRSISDQDLLERASRSCSWIERLAVACNSSTSVEILGSLTKDGISAVGKVAHSRINFLRLCESP